MLNKKILVTLFQKNSDKNGSLTIFNNLTAHNHYPGAKKRDEFILEKNRDKKGLVLVQ